MDQNYSEHSESGNIKVIPFDMQKLTEHTNPPNVFRDLLTRILFQLRCTS